MSSYDLLWNRAIRPGLKVLAALVLALSLAAPAKAEPIQFGWDLLPGDYMGDESQKGMIILIADLRLGEGWEFVSFEVDSPANALNEVLPFRWARYGYTPLNEASNGGYGGGSIGYFSAEPDARAGVYDRVYLPDGSSRPASIRIAAEYLGPDGEYAYGTYRTWAYEIGVTILGSIEVPTIVPEPASLASAGLALVAVGGFLGVRRRRGRCDEGA